MSDMALWELIRASGVLAYVLLSIAVFMGLAVKLRALDGLMRRPWVFEAHQSVSLAALAMVAFHVLLLLFNRHVPFTASQALVPFTASWKPLPSALGTLSLYLVTALVATSYVRGSIGYKTWRAIHYGGFAAWAAAMVHGLTVGSDAGQIWVQYLYLVTGAAVAVLIGWRVLA